MKSVAAGLYLSLLASSAFAQLLTPEPAPAPVAATATSTPVQATVPAAGVADIAASPRVMVARDIAVLQILDKVSARVTTLRVPVGSSAAFGLIFVTARSCQVSPPSETPEAAAFLEISEVDVRSLSRSNGTMAPVTASTTQRLLFSGWMFASSPALSALEHPTYDVTVLACDSRTPTPAETAAAGEEGGGAASAPVSSTASSAQPKPVSATGSSPAAESAQPED